ncbi:hypothetical protein B0E53_01327 [Micromonospora sp. MH33]|uniref:hypothetical protein n=1 Tax=Micromonospora sp. MH33 TaxID=1945509 RepID=UPI000D2AB9BB|nr:hypothetical protein [Micromonospora sp. MH33]PSK66686.1 hypothetical protein B0E53_01327 [Micromonospora sp. MH33]
MEAAARVRAARWADKDHVAALIADALHPDPLAAWLVPEPPRRRRHVLTQVAAIWVEHAMFYGDIHLTDDLNAATVGFHRYRPSPHRPTTTAGSPTPQANTPNASRPSTSSSPPTDPPNRTTTWRSSPSRPPPSGAASARRCSPTTAPDSTAST